MTAYRANGRPKTNDETMSTIPPTNTPLIDILPMISPIHPAARLCRALAALEPQILLRSALRQSPRHQLRNIHQLWRAFAFRRQRIAEHAVTEGAGSSHCGRAGCDEFGCAHLAYPLAGLLAQKCEPAAGSAAEAAFMRARRLDQLTRGPHDCTRLLVYISIAAQVARVMVHNPILIGLLRQPIRIARQKLTVMLDLRRRAVLLPVLLDGAHAMRANGNNLLDLVLGQRCEVGL